jgi:hypothetical protein
MTKDDRGVAEDDREGVVENDKGCEYCRGIQMASEATTSCCLATLPSEQKVKTIGDCWRLCLEMCSTMSNIARKN